MSFLFGNKPGQSAKEQARNRREVSRHQGVKRRVKEVKGGQGAGKEQKRGEETSGGKKGVWQVNGKKHKRGEETLGGKKGVLRR